MKVEFADLLLEKGVLDREQLDKALSIQKKSPLRLEQILLKRGMVAEEKILSLVAENYGYRYLPRLKLQYDEIFSSIPLNLIHKARFVPLGRRGDKITIAISDPANIHPMDELRALLKPCKLEFVLSTEAEIIRVIHDKFDRSSTDAFDVLEGLKDQEHNEFENLSDDILDLANEAPIIRMVNAILARAVEERASDIHIEPSEKSLSVRYRVDGLLHLRLQPPMAAHAGLVSRVKIMANLNIAENRLPQDGRIKLKIRGKDIDIRVSTIPVQYGERIVMRLLNKSDVKYNLENLGFFPQMYKRIVTLVQEQNGIILITGPTGSGKSTTLYAILSNLNDGERNILTAEDPVEYEIPGIGQTQVQEKIGLTFAYSLRAMLRQDPDIIMVGEIRDEETVRIAIQAALTGHLVFSTLHTNDAPSAVTRMLDMGIEPYLITSTVRGVIAQRLARVICPHCRHGYRPSNEELHEIGIRRSSLVKGKLYRGRGCRHCVDTGFLGLTGIYSLMEMTTAVQRDILAGRDAVALERSARNDLHFPLISLLEYGRQKVIDGVTTTEEIMRIS